MTKKIARLPSWFKPGVDSRQDIRPALFGILDWGTIMVDSAPESLILDLLEWLAKRDRSYEEVMDAWRTSCPRLPVWEDANERGLVMKAQVQGQCVIRITPLGLSLLEQRRPQKREATPSV